MKRGDHVMGVAMVDQPYISALNTLSAALKGPHGQTAFFANAATLNLARRTGFEWLHIMLMQPRKLRRYLFGNPVFLVRMISWVRADRLARAMRDFSERAHMLVATFGALVMV